MNILIFFQYSNHNQTIDELCKNLNEWKVEASSFNVATWRFRKKNHIGKVSWVSFLSLLAVIPGLRGFLTTLFRYKALCRLSDNYSIIDIHFFSSIYDKLIEELKRRGKKIKITIWGSDFYRASKVRREEQRKLYQIVDIIQIETRQIADDFLKVYPGYQEKVRIAHFGINQFDIIDDLLQNGSSEIYKKELKIPENKIILTCGTNRGEGHQHLLILDCIEKLTPELKAKIFLIIPMTYGGSKHYIKTIRKKVNSLGLPNQIFTSFLSKRVIGKLRILSNIIITIQVTDALSSAIQEHIYSGDILIAGDWLPYGILKENGVFYLTTTTMNLSETITETIENYESMKNLCIGNKGKLAKLSSWDETIKEWLSIYHYLDNQIIK